MTFIAIPRCSIDDDGAVEECATISHASFPNAAEISTLFCFFPPHSRLWSHPILPRSFSLSCSYSLISHLILVFPSCSTLLLAAPPPLPIRNVSPPPHSTSGFKKRHHERPGHQHPNSTPDPQMRSTKKNTHSTPPLQHQPANPRQIINFSNHLTFTKS